MSQTGEQLNIDHSEQITDNDGRALINFFLQDQQKLTAVEKFSRQIETGTVPLQQKYYRDLIPLSAPKSGEQYAFEVDLDACTGCKACVTACHSMNGLDVDEVWRTVGLLQGGTPEAPIFQTVTAACHHCAEPGCMLGCPTQAYEKDKFTGIVKHLDDQCFGCQYCVLKCPYDVPKYSPSRGIVRKCDMCSSRLAANEAPACVQACPSAAIRIKLVTTADVAQRAAANDFLADSPEPSYTKPTTIYKKKIALPQNSVAADRLRAAPEHSHLPLVFMLVLTQLAVGAFTAEMVAPNFLGQLRPAFTLSAFAFGFFGLNSALLHLGRPLYAWRAFLGWRTSWMSREIIAFSAYMAASSAYATSFWLPKIGVTIPDAIISALQLSTVFTGLVSVICSMLIYIDTRREFWRARFTAVKFALTTALLGTSFALLFAIQRHHDVQAFACTVIFLTLVKLSSEALFLLRHKNAAAADSLSKSALLMTHDLLPQTNFRFICGILGGLLLPLLVLGPASHTGVELFFAALSLLFILLGEWLERYLFFRAVVALKMPGGLAA